MRRFTALRLILALVLPLALLAACSSDDDDSADAPSEQNEDATSGDNGDSGDDASSGDDNACVNTAEEVSEAFGVEVTEAENTALPGGGAGCIYYTDKASGESAMATSLQSGDVAKGVFDGYAADSQSEQVEGIGDGAAWTGSFVIFRKGDTILSLQAGSTVPNSNDQDAIRAILEDLARTAADRL